MVIALALPACYPNHSRDQRTPVNRVYSLVTGQAYLPARSDTLITKRVRMSPLLTLHSVSGVGQLVRKSYSTRDNFSSPLPRFRAASGPHTHTLS